ncbi:GntR domain protein [Halalkalibacter wakoensis JCM 9140]|uniref:GntR domain protein n=1 Tax=Halalkalibacter wakoensis JCM 9140 TaxID=1236970 RepID=W4Q972_9BACI|nr:FCD domain-containing protein [Halalkalibacter wakoensis]GAE28517.1 GntR domain protein [Halalkalibacter wakoensis JCM 9140]
MGEIRESKVEKVYNYCLGKIHTGEWEPGTKLPSENELFESLHVSKVTIRAALQTLRSEGLIITYHGKGSFVSGYIQRDNLDGEKIIVNITPKELLDITEFREAVEVKVAELCIKNATEDDLAEIGAALEEMCECTHDYLKYSKADARFHYAMLKGTHNKVLYHSVLSVQKEFDRYLDELNRVFVSHDLSDSYQLHKQLYNSILEKDDKLATSLVMLNLRRNVLRIKKKIAGEEMEDYLYL